MPYDHADAPAFPRPASEDTRNGTLPEGNNSEDAQPGMTIRTYIATKVLAGLLSNHEATKDNTRDQDVACAVSYADLLIAELNRKPLDVTA